MHSAAMLFVKAGIIGVHGRTMSESGKAYLEAHGIPCTYDILTERIINRKERISVQWKRLFRTLMMLKSDIKL